MRLADIDHDCIARVIATLPRRFDTYHVSRHPDVQRCHAPWVEDRNFHAMIGKGLRQEEVRHRVDYCGQHGRDGSAAWERRDAVPSEPEVAAPAQPALGTGIGPQNPSDPPFRARMRRHQSWYRAAVLQLPYGTGPTRSSTRPLGNMLTIEDGAAGANFVDERAHNAYLARRHFPGAVEPFRCECNLLSSQPLAFNLFGPMAEDLPLATACWRAVLGADVARVLRVELEHAPQPADEFLGDRTAFDALIVYERPDAQRAFVGVEVKLSESLAGAAAASKPAYDRLSSAPGAPWRRESVDTVRRPPTEQLWRDHLLVEAVRRHPSTPGGEHGRFAVVRHPDDAECAAAVGTYRAALARPETFIDLPLDGLVAAWEEVVDAAQDRMWLLRLRRRYLELAASETDPSAGAAR